MIQHTVVTVTPAMATKWLNECNVHNRCVSDAQVNEYAAQMRQNRWHLNGEPIIFTRNKARLLDGQHRLWACIEANAPFKTVIAEGVDESLFATIDTGKKRSAKDVLDIAGIEGTDNRHLAAAAVLVMGYYSGNLYSNGVVSRAKVLEFVEKNPDLQGWVIKARQVRGWSRTFAATLAAVAYIASYKMADEAENFVNQTTSGENLPARSPALALRNRLAAEKRLKASHKMAMIVMAWNAFAENRSLTKLQFPRSDEFPKIVGARR